MQNNRKKDLILDTMQHLMNGANAQSISISDIAKGAGLADMLETSFHIEKGKLDYLHT